MTLKKDAMPTVRSKGFLFWWTFYSLLVYPASILLGIGVVWALTFVIGLIGAIFMSNFNSLYATSGGWWMSALLGGVIGYTLAQFQRHLLQRNLYWTADRWVMLSTIGGMVGGWIVNQLFISPTTDWVMATSNVTIAVAMPLFVGVISGLQWFALRHATRHAWLWVVTNIVAGLVFSNLLGLSSNNISFFVVMLAPIAQGLITGNIMLWLFENHAYPADLTTLDDSDLIVTKRKPSVWDEAI